MLVAGYFLAGAEKLAFSTSEAKAKTHASDFIAALKRYATQRQSFPRAY
jgi:hypothetical protein